MVRVLILSLVYLLIPMVLAADDTLDNDTLLEERKRFPIAMEVIAGKFLRHSPEFCKWKIADCQKKLEKDADNIRIWEDLSMAYHVTGSPDRAMESCRKVLEKHPEQFSSLLLMGKLHLAVLENEKALDYLRKAVHINRVSNEAVAIQRYVEFLIATKAEREAKKPVRNFAEYCVDKLKLESRNNSETEAAVRKIYEGMTSLMTLDRCQTPVLYQAYGDLLSWTGWSRVPHVDLEIHGDAKMLASRAYLRASRFSGPAESLAEFRRKAENILKKQVGKIGDPNPLPLERVEKELAKEIAEAEEWYAILQSNEIGWIKDGKDVEKEYLRLYGTQPLLKSREMIGKSFSRAMKEWNPIWLLGGLSSLVCLLVFWYLVKSSTRSKANDLNSHEFKN